MAVVGKSISSLKKFLPFPIKEAIPSLNLEARLISAGIEVSYKIYPTDSDLSVTTYDNGTHKISMNPTDGAHVWYHELLHLKHLRLDEAAFIGVSRGTPPWVANEIGFIANNLSHAFIIREELDAYPEASHLRQDYYRDVASLLLSHPSPTGFPNRNAWLAASQYLACQNIFTIDTECVHLLQEACHMLGLNIDKLKIDRNASFGEDFLFAKLEDATHYPLHNHARMLRFFNNSVVDSPAWHPV